VKTACITAQGSDRALATGAAGAPCGQETDVFALTVRALTFGAGYGHVFPESHSEGDAGVGDLPVVFHTYSCSAASRPPAADRPAFLAEHGRTLVWRPEKANAIMPLSFLSAGICTIWWGQPFCCRRLSAGVRRGEPPKAA